MRHLRAPGYRLRGSPRSNAGEAQQFSEKLLRPLANALQSSAANSIRRREVVTALGRFGAQDKIAVPQLVQIARPDPPAAVRQTAVEALKR
ncbi:MAG: HEAT repeat domain-containing protein, partial [Verrucomicrobia bacterium]|nr:HEAT repeat domain-containing protein [Verrucomicrobiota bacterium]